MILHVTVARDHQFYKNIVMLSSNFKENLRINIEKINYVAHRVACRVVIEEQEELHLIDCYHLENRIDITSVVDARVLLEVGTQSEVNDRFAAHDRLCL